MWNLSSQNSTKDSSRQDRYGKSTWPQWFHRIVLSWNRKTSPDLLVLLWGQRRFSVCPPPMFLRHDDGMHCGRIRRYHREGLPQYTVSGWGKTLEVATSRQGRMVKNQERVPYPRLLILSSAISQLRKWILKDSEWTRFTSVYLSCLTWDYAKWISKTSFSKKQQQHTSCNFGLFWASPKFSILKV